MARPKQAVFREKKLTVRLSESELQSLLRTVKPSPTMVADVS
jgi:hypothetical protein